MEALLRDLRIGLRMLGKARGVTAIAVLCLALGIGASCAIFSVVNTILLRPLPHLREPERLVMIYDAEDTGEAELELSRVTPFNYASWKEQARGAFAGMEALRLRSLHLTGDGEPLQLRGAAVTAGLFPFLGVEPVLGRPFHAEEDRPGAPAPVVLLGHALWQSHFGSDPSVVGRSILLNSRGYEIVGVMPPGFHFPEGQDFPGGAQLWIPLGLDPGRPESRTDHILFVAARLAPGRSLEEAQRELDVVARHLAQDSPDSNRGWRASAVLLRERLTGDIETALFALLASVGFILALACTTVANLQLARAVGRGEEMAVRTMLGATRRRLFKQLLTESVAMALAGGLLGLVLAFASLRPLVALSPVELIPAFREIRVDLWVLFFTFGVSVLTGALFGLAPALRASQSDLYGVTRQGGSGRTTGGPGQRRLQRVLVVIQVAVALMLLVCAGLLIRSFQRLRDVDPGFDPQRLLAVRLLFNANKFPQAADRVALLDRLLERLRAVPGVVSADAILNLPVGDVAVTTRYSIEGRAPSGSAEEVDIATYSLVGTDYFRTLHIPVVEGRAFTATDTAESAPVAIVNETLARRAWPGESPLGRRIKEGDPGADTPWRTVVGVVGDVRDAGITAPPGATWYLPYRQEDLRAVSLVLRTATGDPAALGPAVRQAVLEVDRDQPIYTIETLEERLAEAMARQRFSAVLIGLFGLLGLLLATGGIYGVQSYAVHQRRHEIGLRMVLGARPLQVLALVVQEGLAVTMAGLVLGLAGALALTRLFASLLYHVSPTDPATLAGVALLMIAVALAAILASAVRAVRVDPIRVIRSS